jgi:hypothetical protein
MGPEKGPFLELVLALSISPSQCSGQFHPAFPYDQHITLPNQISIHMIQN